MRYFKGVTIVGLAFAVGACTDPLQSIPPGEVEACVNVSTVNTSEGLTPNFSWLPECGAGILSIHPVDDTTSLWTVSNIDNKMLPPIRYGTPPENGSQEAQAVPLEAGKGYRLRLGKFQATATGIEPTIVILWLDTFVR